MKVKAEFTKKDDIYQIALNEVDNKGHKCPLLSDRGFILHFDIKPFDCQSWSFYVMKNNDEYLSMITDYNRELEILYRINKQDIKILVNKK